MTPSGPSAAQTPRQGPRLDTPPSFALSSVGRVAGALEILSGVTLSARPGERIALIGPSGAGKTTLLRLLNTTLLPSSGVVEVLGQDAARLSARALRRLRGRIGTVYQQLHLVPQASVIENVLMGRLASRSVWGVALASLRRASREEVAAVLARVGLLEKIDERVDRLSGGEQQRVAVARVLHQAPDLLLADEPFASVDPARTREVVDLLLEAAHGRTLVVSTHQLEPVLPHFPRVVGLRGGKILFDKPRADVAPDDLARLYQPEAATRSTEPRRVFAGASVPAGSEVLIGASTTPGEYLLPQVLVEFRRQHPDVPVRLTVKGTEEVSHRLLAGDVEIALLGARSSHAELHHEDLAEDEIVLVAAPSLAGLPDGPIAPSELARLPRIDREPASATRRIVEAQLSAMGCALEASSVVLEAGSVAALKQAVLAGLGVGFASRLSVAEELASGRLVRLRVRDLEIPRRYFVAWRRSAPPGPAARWLVEAARAAVKSPRRP